MASRSIQVLVVDDEPLASSAFEQLLCAEGFDARVASNGREALDLVEKYTPDIIVTDLRMPEMDGLVLLKELRAKHIEVPVILATAVNDVVPALAAIRAGAAEYLTKPIDSDMLLFAIERALRTSDLHREAAALRAHNEALAAEAERNLRAREELLAIVAHDLRGPLSTILLAASSLDSADGPEAARKLELVERAARHMTKLVEDLLDAARIEMGGLVLDLAPHRASRLLGAVVSMLEPMAEQAGVRLETNILDDFALSCAAERIVQVLSNLASNAINVTERGRRVRLLAELRGEHAWFTVEDEGPGIAPELVPHLFERGFHSDIGAHRGTGLGLTIAKGLVEAHGGVIGVESTLGAGSAFYLKLPLCGPERISWQVRLASTEPLLSHHNRAAS